MIFETPNLKILVMHITYRCNAKCDNCSNQCYQAPSREDMSIQAVETVITDSINLNYKWDKIVLQGGECTLHPEFTEICKVLLKYKRWNTNCIVSINTNGFSEKTKGLLSEMESAGFSTENSFKSKDIMDKTIKYDYIPVNVAPVDVGYTLERMGCFQSSVCGVTVNNQGYWECSPAAGASRVFDFFKPICTQLKDLNDAVAKKGFEDHCKYCGFALPCPRVKEQTTSKTWQEYLDKYNKERKS